MTSATVFPAPSRVGVSSAVTIPPDEFPASDVDGMVVIADRTFVVLFREIARGFAPLTFTPTAWSLLDSSDAITQA